MIGVVVLFHYFVLNDWWSNLATCVGDVEEGNVGNNSHPSDHAGSARNNKADKPEREGSAGPSEAVAKEEKAHSKEKSVLQAKLTKLAIQIGYAGNEEMNQSLYWRLGET